ncbi:hypothetical protein F8566_01570 [Actinomadura rudentiformis]|uniref:Uncharacterized protein n=1 Tax=Actinomadura rudentiformis TaxID=359158 RepID=A0A6H9ZAA3_9ACTN|nr:hypothetical protein F8566_01570 [Actinomadura rudentiformis]
MRYCAAERVPVEPRGAGMGHQRIYGTSDRPIDVVAEVRGGDAAWVICGERLYRAGRPSAGPHSRFHPRPRRVAG